MLTGESEKPERAAVPMLDTQPQGTPKTLANHPKEETSNPQRTSETGEMCQKTERTQVYSTNTERL